MSSKVLLPKNVAEALTHLKLECGSQGILAGILGSVNTRPFEILKNYIEPIGGFEVLLEVLVNGYEVEETPEDKVRERFKGFMVCAENPDAPYEEKLMFLKLAEGMRHALDILNIKIEGVNA